MSLPRPEHDERVHEEERPAMSEEDRHILRREERPSAVGYAAIKYAAIVIIVLAVLYFLAVFIVPLFR